MNTHSKPLWIATVLAIAFPTMPISSQEVATPLLPTADDSLATPITNPLAPSDQMLDLSQSVKLVRVMEYQYQPSQRDPFISHEIISPFVTEDELEEELEDEERKLPSQKEVQEFLEKYIQISGISTGDTGGGYALASIAIPAEGDAEAGFRQRILKPGQVVKVPLDEEALLRFGEAFLFWDWTATGSPALTLITTQIHERYMELSLDKNGNIKEEDLPKEIQSSVAFQIKPTKPGKQKSPFNEFHIRYRKDFSIDTEE